MPEREDTEGEREDTQGVARGAGPSPAEQIRSDLEEHPTLAAFLAELVLILFDKHVKFKNGPAGEGRHVEITDVFWPHRRNLDEPQRGEGDGP